MSRITQVFIVCVLMGIILPNISFAQISYWQKGVSIYPRSTEDFGSYDIENLLKQISNDNANYVTFVLPYYLDDYRGSNILRGIDTPSDESIIQAIKWAHEDGLAVMLKPHLDAMNTSWRAYINPTDRDAWFTNYENLLEHYGVIGATYGAEEICIGTELISVASEYVNKNNTTRWEKMISDLRQYYHGKLTYSANWGPQTSKFADEKNNIGFWKDLDYIGISTYVPFEGGSVDSLKKEWELWDQSDIINLYQEWNKQIIFTEVGYRSSRNSLTAPYDFRAEDIYNADNQINGYQALFEYWKDKPYMAGVSMWDFYSGPNAGGVGNTDYTPQGKPAEQIMKSWFDTSPKQTSIVNVPVHQPVKEYILLDNINSFLRTWMQQNWVT